MSIRLSTIASVVGLGLSANSLLQALQTTASSRKMTLIKRMAFLAIVFTSTSNSAIGAEVKVMGNSASTPEIGRTIEVSGEIVDGDDLRLRAALHNAPPNTLVLLTSQGGLIAPAMSMGRIIRKSGVNTLAVGVCASACGLIWLAGTKRFSMSDSQIGFHAAYSGANSAVTGTGNALIGGYVSELGFGDNVIRYITEKPPEGMQWLNDREANLLGIDVTTIENENVSGAAAPAVKPKSDGPEESAEVLRKSAVTKMLLIVEKHSDSSETALSYVKKNYAAFLSYYGKRVSLAEVVEDKRGYLDRWPVRSSNVKIDSVDVNCDSETCLVTGVYDWSVSNPDNDKKAYGTATFGYGFAIAQNMQVIFEDGKVLSRK